MRIDGRLLWCFAWNGQGDCFYNYFPVRGVPFEIDMVVDGIPRLSYVGNYLYFLSRNVGYHRYLRLYYDTSFVKKALTKK